LARAAAKLSDLIDSRIVCVSVCLSATLMLNICRKLRDLGVGVQWGPKVPTARRLVTSSDSMTSHSWSHNLQSRRIRQRTGSTVTTHTDPSSKHYRRTFNCVKQSNQLIRFRTLREEAFGISITLPRVKFANNGYCSIKETFDLNLLQFDSDEWVS